MTPNFANFPNFRAELPGLSGSFQVGLDMSRADLMGMMNKMGMLPPEAQAQLSQLTNGDQAARFSPV
ncbi:MAG: hypothetical protein ABI824_07035 [Acidobacteriota bacterium]